MGQRRLRRRHHLCLRHLRLPVGDIVAHRVVEQDGVLGHNPYLAPQ